MDNFWVVRTVLESDLNFIKPTYLRGLYFGNSFLNKIPKLIYYPMQSIVLSHLLDHSTVLVACDKDDHDIILGFCIFDRNVLHWVHVKKPFRRQGIAKSLIPSSIQTVSHLTAVGESFKPKDWNFNPYSIFVKDHNGTATQPAT